MRLKSIKGRAALHPDVVLAMSALGTDWTDTCNEPDNAEYGAALSRCGSTVSRFRVGKITPTKMGMFVAVWRRAADGSTEPFPASDSITSLIVVVREDHHFGAFTFPKDVLEQQQIVSADGKGGKRGFRVYPPWVAVSSPQAIRTQEWQCANFVEFAADTSAERGSLAGARRG